MTARYVRVIAALIAAITLHAVLLSWPLPTSQHIAVNNGLLHVDLVKAARPSVAQAVSPIPHAPIPHAPIPHAQPETQQKPSAQPERNRHQQPPTTTRTVAATRQPRQMPAPVKARVAKKNPLPATRHEAGKSSPSLHAKTTQVADRLPVSHGESATLQLSPTMAAGVQSMQSMLLANIHYPAQARRHGWQGAGEFQLDIDSQSIRKITMLMSTGHAILDRAVRRGLGSIEHVPVANGQYRLPVEFRLQ